MEAALIGIINSFRVCIELKEELKSKNSDINVAFRRKFTLLLLQ